MTRQSLAFCVPGLTALLLFGVGLLSAPGQTSSLFAKEDSAKAARLREQVNVILNRLEGQPRLAASEAAELLRGLGPEAIPTLLSAYRNADGGGAEAAAAERSVVLVRALRRLPTPDVLAGLEKIADQDPDLPGTVFVMRALGRLELGCRLDILTSAAGRLQSPHLEVPSVAGAILGTLRVMIQQSPHSHQRLKEAWSDMPPPLRGHAAHILRERGSRSATSLLVELLVRHPEDASVIQEAVRPLPAVLFVGLDPQPLRRHLSHQDPAVRKVAATVLQRIHDIGSLPYIVPLLNDGDARVREAACAVLQAMVGTHLGPDAADWEARIKREQQWGRTTDVSRLLANAAPAAIVAVLRSLGDHSLFRDELVEPIASLLDHEIVEIRLSALVALRGLGSPRAIPTLIECLNLENPVRHAAWSTLKHLTGVDLPVSRSRWREAQRRWDS